MDFTTKLRALVLSQLAKAALKRLAMTASSPRNALEAIAGIMRLQR